MRHIVIRTFDEWLAQESVDHYPYEKSFEEAAHDPFIVIHTSGSTGLPKPITLYHGGLATPDAHHLMPTLDGYHPELITPKAQRPICIFATLPPFHVSHSRRILASFQTVWYTDIKMQVAGILGALLLPLYCRQTIVWPPAGRPVSADMVDELLDNVEVDACFLAPSVIEDLSQSETSLEKLKKLQYVEYGGGQIHSQSLDSAMLTEDQGLLPDVLVI